MTAPKKTTLVFFMKASKSLTSLFALVNLIVFRWETCNLLAGCRSEHFTAALFLLFNWGKLLTNTANRNGIVQIIYVATVLIWICLLAQLILILAILVDYSLLYGLNGRLQRSEQIFFLDAKRLDSIFFVALIVLNFGQLLKV